MAEQVDFEQHRRLLLHWAHRIQRRLYSAGSQSTMFDDIYQELCVAWTIARNSYDPTSGVPFGAYLATGLRNHVNRYANKEIEAHGWGHLDMDAPLGEDAGDNDAHSVVADPLIESAFDALNRKQAWEENLECLSAPARKFLELLESPPAPLINILKAQQAKKQFAIARGLPPGFYLKKLTASLIFDVMGASSVQRAAIMHEIRLLDMNPEQPANA